MKSYLNKNVSKLRIVNDAAIFSKSRTTHLKTSFPSNFYARFLKKDLTSIKVDSDNEYTIEITLSGSGLGRLYLREYSKYQPERLPIVELDYEYMVREFIMNDVNDVKKVRQRFKVKEFTEFIGLDLTVTGNSNFQIHNIELFERIDNY